MTANLHDPRNVVFVCVANRLRSVFSEFFFEKLLAHTRQELSSLVKPTSAGFIPATLKNQLQSAHVGFPEPFYHRPMAEIARSALFEEGIVVPQDWRSKKLNGEMIWDADLVITALQDQKEELSTLYSTARSKFYTIREMSGRSDYLLFEDFDGLPMDHTYWDYVEGDPVYVSKIIRETRESLLLAFPKILNHLGLEPA
ncbi:MAG: hypothetical protein CVU64_24220 [Deltaproteobacteria bacterium HGW-Deltaproteobacteria-21]|nr:MAG: hypothetical protein CVU64_24220 [Deltaproteobacteria bacterium HGW-Deltaproteobacteria-21]